MANPRVSITTRMGSIVIELNAEKAPATVANFLAYVDSGHYVGTIFHRVIPGFMAQGGGMSVDMDSKKTMPPIQNEADNGLKNARGTIAMARTGDPHSATSQFFINLKDNGFLDYTASNPQGYGYAVFGHVIDGMAVVDAMATLPTGRRMGHSDVPAEDIIITAAERLED
ncbi:MAG: cyclophilin [Halothiobacillus sp. 24-54-40]|jgi:peptidyl-prolyl cis-trans isomerase B (cyclophilin B)|nr:peptidyl-prolyl cis-trans isomerase [Halothiobacillaceae bacterium]OYV46606.1 MAG: cyclophilin [Halothiobacillus sp. 20-53-49]OYY42532.1 MAG: cyclophilin [Halothiobacillus sp. 35-54-62]OYZ87936.1 MAG: cyclophilin [Halothiobacillus sp. 24-54-40]OZA81445.1 MAG: cyclophilin [Halothiobacillus sp. 39-53-45]HQS02142.1 peptidylprolyl isomerase [Halothiobacillus sp.]